MTTFFTSDTHYHHSRIIEYSKRPFKDVEEMNEALITNYNSVIKSSDDVYHLGDFAFADKDAINIVLRRLNGRKHLIFGNHDKQFRKYKELLSKHFIWAKDYAEINVDNQKIILSHYSFRVWNASHRGSWNLYGHSHCNLFDDPKLLSIDVGVDCHSYYPIPFEEVKKIMSQKTWTSPISKDC